MLTALLMRLMMKLGETCYFNSRLSSGWRNLGRVPRLREKWRVAWIQVSPTAKNVTEVIYLRKTDAEYYP